VASENKAKVKLGAKAGKDDGLPSPIAQADDICQAAISKIDASFESKIYITTVWAELASVKAEEKLEPIDHLGDLARLLTSLELSELAADSKITLEIQPVLSAAISSFHQVGLSSRKIQFETLLRIIQVAMKKDLDKLAYGCLHEIQALGLDVVPLDAGIGKV
jgi:hypothetical protein